MGQEKKPDHRAIWREEAINRIASILYAAEIIGCDPEELLQASRKHVEVHREEMEQDSWD